MRAINIKSHQLPIGEEGVIIPLLLGKYLFSFAGEEFLVFDEEIEILAPEEEINIHSNCDHLFGDYSGIDRV